MSGLSKTEFDFALCFAEIARRIHLISKEKGFYESDRQVPELIALMHSELSEALEADRKKLMDDKISTRLGLEVELADCIIRIMDASAYLGLDVGTAIIEKMKYNSTREYKHGKAY